MRMNKILLRSVLPAKLILMTMLFLMLVACAGGTPFRNLTVEQNIQWPSPPMPAMVAWVKNVRDYPDAGITKSTWKRLTDFVFGEKDTAIGRPYGVYMDGQDRLFIVDVALRRVHVMDSQQNKYTVIGGADQEAFQTPVGVTVDDADNVYITDSEAGTVFRYNMRTQILTPFVTNLLRPTGIAFNKTNRLLYVSETAAHQVVLFDLNGRHRLHIGRRGERNGEFNLPTDLFVDQRGKLYVTDPINARIQIFSAEGTFIRTLGSPGDAQGEFSKPKGIAVDSTGNIYVCDALRDSVQVFDDKGKFLLEFGDRGQDSGKFWMPSGLYIDKDNYIFVADTYNRRIQVLRRMGPATPVVRQKGF